MLIRIAARLILGLLLLVSLAVSAQQTPGEFTIAALPDTQIYCKTYPQIFNAQTKWIADNAHAMNIRLVVGLGDIVDGGGELRQWQNADTAYRLLDGKVPYIAAIGNHDYDHNNPAGRTGSAKNFNSYFGPDRYRGQSFYRASYVSSSNENFYSIFNFGGREYLILVLEVFPRNSVLTWANAVAKNHPESDIIVVTHAYTYADSTRMDKCDSNSAASMGVAQDNDGEQVWEKFVSKHKNITMVLSGHVVQGDGTGHRTDIGVNGNAVVAMLSDYQSWPNGGNGYLRLITVKPAINQVDVRTYSPYLNHWLTDSHNQFSLPYQTITTTRKLGAIAGRVKNASNCSGVSGITISNGVTSVTTDAQGNFSLPAIGPESYTLKVQGLGLMTPNQVASAVPNRVSPAKVIVASSGTVSGRLTLKLSPLSSIKVTLNGGALRQSISTITGPDGSFTFKNVSTGSYQITAYPPGSSTTWAISVSAGVTSRLTINLE